MKKSFLAIFWFLVFCLWPLYHGASTDPKDHLNLSFTKTLSIKKYGKMNVHCEPHIIKEGEWLWKILRDEFKIPSDQRVEFLRILKAINPAIFNADQVYPGQEILVPIRLEAATENTQPLRESTAVGSPPSGSPSFYIKQHIVSPGESVSSILLHTYKVPKHLVFQEFIKLFCALNPNVNDPNIIKVDQQVRVPVHKPIPETEPEPAEKKNAEPMQSKDPGTPQDLHSPGEVRNGKALAEEVKTIPATTETNSQALKDSIGTFFTNLGDRYNNRGDYHIPVPGGGEVTLNSASFPMVEMENGRKLIIDFGDQVPGKVEKLIASSWENYGFVNIRKEENVHAILGKLFALSGYYSVIRGEEPLVLSGDITVEVRADWIIIKDKDSAQSGKTLAVNIAGDTAKSVPRAIRSYLGTRGVKVVVLDANELLH